MKRFLLHLSFLSLLLATALGGMSCSDEREEVQEEEEARKREELYGTYLKVTIRVDDNDDYGGTRAGGPDGGETGNGTETGRNNENKVYNVTLLLYRDAAGINSKNNPKVEFALYAPVMNVGSDGKTYTSDILHHKNTLPRGELHAIALVNMGDRTDLEGKTLAEVRDMKVSAPYKLGRDAATGMPTNTADADNFVMTSAEDVSFVLGDVYGINNPINVQIPVERMAARLDFSPGKVAETLTADGSCATWVEESVPVEEGGEKKDVILTGYKYAVLNADTKTPTQDRFILTGVTPFNCLTSGTYCIKRVRNELEGGGTELVYLGDEEMNAEKNATNYVLDPWTEEKNTATDPDGVGYRNRLTSSYLLLDEDKRWPVKQPEADLEVEGLKYYILDYTQENTLLPGYGKERYATGLLISGYYGSADAEGNIEKYVPQNYHYYIRHADPNSSSDESLPMKYGIVRNNIYRIHVNSVNSLGQIQIVVNDWRRINVPEIQI